MAQTEAVLLQRFTGSGDAEAFAEIIRRHAGLVYGAALRILADVDRASDVAQETFLQLTKDAGHVTGSLPGWLHRVATHKAIDEMRRDASRRHREREYAANEEQPCEPVEWKDISPYVDVGLRELDPELRDVLILHFLQGRTTREIALLKGASQATISRRIGSGVEQLRVKLRKRGILLAVGALSLLLGDNGVQAAPLPLLTELGKMAIVGGTAVGAAGTGLHTVAMSVLTVVKTKAVAVAAVAVIGAGSVVTYHEMTKPSFSEPVASAPAQPIAASPVRDPTGSLMDSQRKPGLPDNQPQAQTQWDQPAAARPNPTGTLGREASVPQESVTAFTADGGMESMPAAEYGGMVGGFGGMGGSVGSQNDTQEQQTGQTGGFYDDRRVGDRGDAGQSEDPNLHEPNDPGKP
ncbi:MAG: sigma-70 family RNA polymerase sigma factor [Phycisphaerae bacterium]|nr:sigma-70 family RNA polymerase sigma factor [Phycisphaerae bacterium]